MNWCGSPIPGYSDPDLVAATLEPLERGKQLMGIILLVLLLALILGGLGFAVHILWWIALIVLVIWLIGFVVRVGEGGSRGRWYRWLPAPRG
jgi:membrane protein YdbS with pleckstrin-like domain